MTSDVDAVQERVLAEILGRNAGAEYLKSCGLDGSTADRATFRAKVPLMSYADVRPYIQRIADGDRSPILSTTHPICEFFTSSGTSGGERKLTPIVSDELDRRRLFNSLIMPVVNSHFPGIDQGGKGLYFLFVRPATKTPGGLAAQPALSSYYRSKEHFRCDKLTSPMEAILCEDTFQSMYAHLLCGLCQRHDVVRIGAGFAAVLLRSINFLQLNWEQLAADIEHGVLAARVTDPGVRHAVAGVLGQADPVLARFVRAECSKGDWAGIVTRIWPNTRYLEVIVTGTMAQYVPTLRHYCGAGLPLVSTKYGLSECGAGINLSPLCDPKEVSYTLMPCMAYFEFLPLQLPPPPPPVRGTDDGMASQLVELARVEVGREYELVVTTHGGLSRYRVGDVLRVTGFHNTAPQFRFVRREGVLLSVEFDKTGEDELHNAVERASALLRPHGASVAEYTAHACTKRFPGHYVIYWELLLTVTAAATRTTTAATANAKKTLDMELDSCCLEMEEALNVVYRHCRAVDGSIGPLEIRVVRQGTFADLMDYAVSRGTSVSQYKVPRCVTLPHVIQLLDSHIISTHFSPGLPHHSS